MGHPHPSPCQGRGGGTPSPQPSPVKGEGLTPTPPPVKGSRGSPSPSPVSPLSSLPQARTTVGHPHVPGPYLNPSRESGDSWDSPHPARSTRRRGGGTPSPQPSPVKGRRDRTTRAPLGSLSRLGEGVGPSPQAISRQGRGGGTPSGPHPLPSRERGWDSSRQPSPVM